MEQPEELVALRTTSRRARADEWLLVLASEGFRAGVRGSAQGFVLEVPADERERALAALAAFERENVPVPPAPEPPALDAHPVQHALLVASALLAGFVVTGPADGAGAALAARGHAHAGRIQDGEWWLALTALTLHADAGHVLGNAVVGALFLSAVFRAFGFGVGVALVVAAGALGNLANAAFRSAEHASIGASTAVFAALGIAAAHSRIRRRAALRGRPVWAPLGAAFALLAMLGTEGDRVDLWAHALGLVAGLALGALAAAVPAARLARRAVQWPAGAAAIAAIAGAWLLASSR